MTYDLAYALISLRLAFPKADEPICTVSWHPCGHIMPSVDHAYRSIPDFAVDPALVLSGFGDIPAKTTEYAKVTSVFFKIPDALLIIPHDLHSDFPYKVSGRIETETAAVCKQCAP